ncbi:hypothetical protein A2975_02405 [Candidatus Woesebacteria bacterium RIFCSPLOWO2_01_FULL_44_14]|uniref:Single cache domain-containing protein n=1 Tax=Candidatus Woesebacteria bacterium RIFCSPLOWO2_01_FULL_44_14 TaxID=1802525 RepID=A0A1F8BYN8_9BACT|nr:MAG: hypothetical protein A2975_02405 [Candidatus Woesebacteria bacterium RIFCSPLOWO2_01_FULL_44_14]
MLIAQFVLVNSHFVVSLLAALVLFAIFWLYFDAWLNNKDLKQSLPFLGFLLLSISFVAQALILEQELLAQPLLGAQTLSTLKSIFRIGGYLALILGQTALPLQPLPGYREKGGKTKAAPVVFFAAGLSVTQLLAFSYPILAALTGVFYLRRATKGLEHHLKPLALAFFILSFSELTGLASVFRTTDDIILSKIVAPFGVVWIVERIVLITSLYFFGKWAWSYLLKRFESQLFIIFTTSTLLIFLVTAVSFTFAILRNVQADLSGALKTDVGVLGYTIESKKSEVLSDTEVVAQNPLIAPSLKETDLKALADIAVPTLLAKKASNLILTSSTGQVILRAEDTQRQGDSLSDDIIIKRAIAGEKVSSATVHEGATAPVVSIRAGAPITSEGEVIGAAMVGVDIDNAFVDGVKKATGLETSIYADSVRSATTILAPDGKSRFIGIKEENEEVKKTVLGEGNIYSGSVKILNVPYYAVFAPLKNIDGNPIGMLFVGKPEVSLLSTASRSIEITFITTTILLILSVFPSYLISKYITSQIK